MNDCSVKCGPKIMCFSFVIEDGKNVFSISKVLYTRGFRVSENRFSS